jgi:phenylpyruvate tautomerase PptA (4-oxalocrotonate tautomerase family)
MPLIEIERVVADADAAPAVPPGLAQACADAAARVFGSPPGRTWVRLRMLPASAYAENDAAPAAEDLPVFVTVLHAHAPEGDALAAQVRALTDAIAVVLAVDTRRVHVQMAPAGAGRQAFGGRLVS